jgi:hypothetical protein
MPERGAPPLRKTAHPIQSAPLWKGPVPTDLCIRSLAITQTDIVMATERISVAIILYHPPLRIPSYVLSQAPSAACRAFLERR